MANKDVTALYADAPPEQVAQLQRFRENHPYRRLVVDGVEWSYIASGEGQQALFILGGALSTGESSFSTIQRMENHFRVISPSYPPVGDMGVVCRGLAAILEHEGLGQAHLFGHSMGAAVAHVFVRQFPEQVDRLVLSGFGLYSRRNARKMRSSLSLFNWLPFGYLRGLYTRRIEAMVAQVKPEEQAFLAAYFRDLLEVQHTRTSFLGQFNILADMARRPDQYRVFEPVEKPGQVLILQAQDDRGFQPDEQEALQETYPGAQVYEFEFGGHWVMLTRRAEYEAVLDEFLGLTGREPAGA
jgi:pimeloyl-ACP methyl ester carboxylesterase